MISRPTSWHQWPSTSSKASQVNVLRALALRPRVEAVERWMTGRHEAASCVSSGIPWEDLPQELGFDSSMTCWRRLRDWQTAGVWEKPRLAILRRLHGHDAIAAVPGLTGLPRKRPGKLHTDKGYDFARCRRYLQRRGITARIARRGGMQRTAGAISLGSRAHAPGLPVSANCASASNDVSIRISLCLPWPLPLSALGSLMTCVSRSKCRAAGRARSAARRRSRAGCRSRGGWRPESTNASCGTGRAGRRAGWRCRARCAPRCRWG